MIFVCHLVRRWPIKVKLLWFRWVSTFEIAYGSRKTFDALCCECWDLRCWRWCSMKQIPLSLLNLDSIESYILRNFDLIIFFLMRWHFARAIAQLFIHHSVRLCTFVYMEAYLSEIGRDDHLWKSFAYAQLFFSLSLSFLEKKYSHSISWLDHKHCY